MAHTTIELEASWFAVQSFGYQFTPPLNSRVLIPDSLVPAGQTRYFENLTLRRDRLGWVLNIAPDQTTSFAQTGNLRLSSAFENDGILNLDIGTLSLRTSLGGRDLNEPYVFNFTGDEAATYSAFRSGIDALSPSSGNLSGTLTLWDGAGPSPFATAPVFASATTNDDGTEVIITFDQALDENSVPSVSSFDVQADGSARAVSDVSLSGTDATLTMENQVFQGETITVAYTRP